MLAEKPLPLALLTLCLASCTAMSNMLSHDKVQAPAETFAAADRPSFEKDADADFKLQKPWNHDKEWNKDRKYPLVVSLHGGGGSYYTPCLDENDEELKKYPCFVMAPHNQGWGENAAWVRNEIEELRRP